MSALHRERWFPVWLVLPGALALLVLWLLPTTILLQLTLGSGAATMGRIGQFMGGILRDPTVQAGLLDQGLRLLVALGLEMLLGLLLARALPLHGRSAGLWCMMLGICLFTPLVVSMMGWGMLHAGPGVLPGWLLSWLGESVDQPWWWLEGMYLLRDLWQWVPLFALLCLAELRQIERYRYRAVQFDGGSAWAAFRLLEWPRLRGALLLGLTLRLLLGAIVDVDVFHAAITAEEGALAQLGASQGWLANGVLSTVPDQAPLSWLLPALVASSESLDGIVPVVNLTASLGLTQVLLVLPLLILLLWIIRRGNRHGMLVPVVFSGADEVYGPQRGCFVRLCRALLRLLWLVFALLPFVWLAWAALQVELPGQGRSIGLGHFMVIFDDQVWRQSLWRTFVGASLTALVAVLLALPMAYSMSRRLLAGDRPMAMMLMVSLMTPAMVLAFPLGHISQELGWLGSPWAVGVAHLVFTVPLAVWVLTLGMAEVPVTVDEVAMRDGFGFMRFMAQVLLPGVRHRLWAAFLGCFLLAWMEFLFARVMGSMVWPPLVVLLSESLAALPPDQMSALRTEWQVLAAAAWLLLVPVFLSMFILRYQLADLLSLRRGFMLLSRRRQGRPVPVSMSF